MHAGAFSKSSFLNKKQATRAHSLVCELFYAALLALQGGRERLAQVLLQFGDDAIYLAAIDRCAAAAVW